MGKGLRRGRSEVVSNTCVIMPTPYLVGATEQVCAMFASALCSVMVALFCS